VTKKQNRASSGPNFVFSTKVFRGKQTFPTG